MKSKSSKDSILLIAFFASGITALGFELMWTKLLSLTCGGEVIAILGVLTGFFGGMMLGAFIFSKSVKTTRNPIRLFIILEFIVVIYGILSPHLIFSLTDALPGWLASISDDPQSVLSLLLTTLTCCLILVPATIGMGANFAFLIEARKRVHGIDEPNSTSVGRLYASNTLGAVIGIIFTIYYLIPMLGFNDGALVLGLVGLISIAAASVWNRGKQYESIKETKFKTSSARSGISFKTLLLLTGLLTIGLEINVVHLLKQLLQNTIFTFGNLLLVYLLGTSIGAWLYHILVINKNKTRWVKPEVLISGQIISILGILILIHLSPSLLTSMTEGNTDFISNITAEIVLAMLIFLFPTMVMGAIFTWLISQLNSSEIGNGYGFNILGSTLAPFFFGILSIPIIGSYRSVILIGLFYLALLIYVSKKMGWKNRPLRNASFATILVISAFFPPGLIELPDGWTILHSEEGLMGTTIVSENQGQKGPFGLPMKVLQINSRFRMGGGAGFLERRMGSLPMLLNTEIDSALYLGLGTGTTLGMAKHNPISHIDAVEIVPEVESMLKYFSDHNQDIFNAPHVNYHTSDARRFVRAAQGKYDLIVGDLFHPARDGAGLLFTLDHFAYLSDRLTDEGMVVQWIPIYQFDNQSLKSVIWSFLQVFPRTHAFIAGYNANLPSIALISRKGELAIDIARLDRFLNPGSPYQLVYENKYDVVASHLLGPEAIHAWTRTSILNTDQHPVVMFDAPRKIYQPDELKAKVNMREILELRKKFPSKLWIGLKDAEIETAIETWKAAGLFFKGNLAKMDGNYVQALEFYIDSYQNNPDFSPARGQLFQLAIEEQNLRRVIMDALIERDRTRIMSIINDQ